jgi:hypothetical protein
VVHFIEKYLRKLFEINENGKRRTVAGWWSPLELNKVPSWKALYVKFVSGQKIVRLRLWSEENLFRSCKTSQPRSPDRRAWRGSWCRSPWPLRRGSSSSASTPTSRRWSRCISAAKIPTRSEEVPLLRLGLVRTWWPINNKNRRKSRKKLINKFLLVLFYHRLVLTAQQTAFQT